MVTSRKKTEKSKSSFLYSFTYLEIYQDNNKNIYCSPHEGTLCKKQVRLILKKQVKGNVDIFMISEVKLNDFFPDA